MATPSVPALHDAEADATLALLDKALGLVAQADEATAKDMRDRADAAMLLARRKKFDGLQRYAAELKLRAEARLGEIAGPAMTPAQAGKSSRAGGGEHSPPANAQGLDKDDLSRCRKVAAVKSSIGAYLDYVRTAGEDPSRAGLLKWTDALEKAARAAAEKQEQNPKPATRSTLDGSGKAQPSAPAAMEGATTGAAVIGKLKISNRPKDQPKGKTKKPAPDVYVAAKWRAVVNVVDGAREQLAREIPVRLALPGKEDIRESYHRNLLKLLDEWLYIAREAVETDSMLVEGYAKERARASVSA